MNICIICHSNMNNQGSWESVFLQRSKKKLCYRCSSKIVSIGGETCKICDKPIDVNFKTKDGLCYDCNRWEKSEHWRNLLHMNRSVYVYNDFMKDTIALFKYRGDYAVVECFRQELNEALKRLPPFDFLVPIPLSKNRILERGFNQSLALALLLEAPIHEVLNKADSEKQSKKTRNERINTKAPFIFNDKMLLCGKTILLVDDIYTTGTTLRHAAKVLKDNGAITVSAITLLRSI